MSNHHDWQKSSFSGGDDGNNCVEVKANTTETVVLRESDSPHEVITTTPQALSGLIRHLKSNRK